MDIFDIDEKELEETEKLLNQEDSHEKDDMILEGIELNGEVCSMKNGNDNWIATLELDEDIPMYVIKKNDIEVKRFPCSELEFGGTMLIEKNIAITFIEEIELVVFFKLEEKRY